MDEPSRAPSLGRREFAGPLAAAALAAALPELGCGERADAAAPRDAADPDDRAIDRAGPRTPAIFAPHGGGPWPFVDLPFGDRREQDALAGYLRSIAALARPRAIVVISAHWEAPVPTVLGAARPPMLYDYYGFPPAAYAVQWPAPGDPALASRVRGLLEAAGFATATDDERGYDHGTFVPLALAYPAAEVPTIQLSLIRGLDPAQHLAMGRALAPLRDEGVLLVGSGMSYHNLRAFGAGGIPASEAFDAWLRRTVALPPAERDRGLTRWFEAPSARAAHPREEHLMPLMVIAGAAADDPASIPYHDTLVGLRLSAVHFG
ncbi:MAG: class III extradiol ring-cleavage dioxygenase [Nannocystaceae bacterium]